MTVRGDVCAGVDGALCGGWSGALALRGASRVLSAPTFLDAIPAFAGMTAGGVCAWGWVALRVTHEAHGVFDWIPAFAGMTGGGSATLNCT